jgi:preprotein translocase subunit YajC
MWSDAFAQAAGAPTNAGPFDAILRQIVPIFPMLMLFAVIYFLMIRPQQQRQKKLDLMLKEVKKGDRVLTNGGIIGTVVGVDDARAVLKIADEVKVEFTKSAIVQVLTVETK